MEVDATKLESADSKPCIYAFDGAAYQGLQASTISESAMSYLQENLRIIDLLYGVLRPLDTIQPYQLEMATRNVFPDKKLKLADWWQSRVTERLSQDWRYRNEKILLNLASDKYSAAVNVEHLSETSQHVKVVFLEGGRVIVMHAKHMRGVTVRYLAKSSVETLQGVQSFDMEGYEVVEKASDETTLIFDRKKAANKMEKPAEKKRRVSK
jgi:cytoplasmic iron level regulating protein YaaA (DUF328/UPF0246 family)